jgi:hypothetical protein
MGIHRTDTIPDVQALWDMQQQRRVMQEMGAGSSARDSVDHAIREFMGGVAIEMEDQVGDQERWERLASGVFAALHKASPQKPHPIVHAILGGIVTLFLAFIGLAFNAGVMSNRMAQAEMRIDQDNARVSALEIKAQGIEVVGAKIDALQRTMDRVLDDRRVK